MVTPNMRRKRQRKSNFSEMLRRPGDQSQRLIYTKDVQHCKGIELPTLHDLPLIPFSPPDFLMENSSKKGTFSEQKKAILKQSFNSPLDKVIGEAKIELLIERTKPFSDNSDYIFISNFDSGHKSEFVNKNVVFDDYMEMSTVRIQHRLYAL